MEYNRLRKRRGDRFELVGTQLYAHDYAYIDGREFPNFTCDGMLDLHEHPGVASAVRVSNHVAVALS